MTPRNFILPLLVAAASGLPATATTPPNVVVILADDLGFADVSFTHPLFIPNPALRPPEVHTPNIDSLAQAGIIFSNGYVSGNVCSPTRQRRRP